MTSHKDFSTNLNGVYKPFAMEIDLNFRAQFEQHQHRGMYEVLEALDHSNVEDLISYKLKDDKHKNLLTLDDLRVKQIKVATELRGLQGTKADYSVPEIGLAQYESMIKEPVKKGEFSAVVQNRTMDELQQEILHKNLGTYEKRKKMPMAAVK